MSKVVYTDGQGNAIVGRLNWSVYSGSVKSRTHIRKSASRHGAKRYVLFRDKDTNRIGLETDDVSTTTAIKAKRRYAFALLCRELLHVEMEEGGTANGIFVMSCLDKPESPDRRAVCVIRNGEIAMDLIDNAERVMQQVQDAYSGMAGYCMVFSDSEDVPLQGVTHIEWSDLTDFFDKSMQLNTVPISPMVPLGILIAACVAGGAFGYHQLVYVPMKKAERAKRAAEQDKTQQYVKALAQAAESVGWSRASLIEQIDALKSKTYFHNGWVLKQLTCTPTKCTETWQREGGLLPDLIAANSGATLLADARMRPDEAIFERQNNGKAAQLNLETLPTGSGEIQQLYKPVIQTLDNVGIKVSLGREKTWPAFDAAKVKKKQVLVKAHKFDVTTAYTLATEAVSKLPSNVVIDSFTLKTTNPKTYILTVEGNGYVR